MVRFFLAIYVYFFKCPKWSTSLLLRLTKRKGFCCGTSPSKDNLGVFDQITTDFEFQLSYHGKIVGVGVGASSELRTPNAPSILSFWIVRKAKESVMVRVGSCLKYGEVAQVANRLKSLKKRLDPKLTTLPSEVSISTSTRFRRLYHFISRFLRLKWPLP